MPDYRLDRNAFKAQSFKEASDYAGYYKSLTWQERLRITAYLNSKAFNYAEHHPPRLDKTKFNVRSRFN